MNIPVNLSKVIEWSQFLSVKEKPIDEIVALYEEAKGFLEFYDWCDKITEKYVGMIHEGIIGVFLFKIAHAQAEIDDWVWVIVGDLPPAYLTCEECPNPATAIDGYIGAMSEWVDAAINGKSVADLIPVNVPATKKYGEQLKVRLDFLDNKILSHYEHDLKE